MKTLKQYADELTLQQCKDVILSYAHLCHYGSLGDCLLREIASEIEQNRHGSGFLIVHMKDLHHEVVTILANKYLDLME